MPPIQRYQDEQFRKFSLQQHQVAASTKAIAVSNNVHNDVDTSFDSSLGRILETFDAALSYTTAFAPTTSTPLMTAIEATRTIKALHQAVDNVPSTPSNPLLDPQAQADIASIRAVRSHPQSYAHSQSPKYSAKMRNMYSAAAHDELRKLHEIQDSR